MEKYTLIGHPVGHSMSSFIHTKLFELKGRNAEYTITDIEPSELQTNKIMLEKLNGYNITIPHKVNIIPMIDELECSAQRYHSVNCVHNINGKAIGYNTDCDGFLRSVGEIKSGSTILLIGCGGVGRMMAIEAVSHGAVLTIAIIKDAQDMADNLVCEIKENFENAIINVVLITDICGDFDLLINATPVGMYPKIQNCAVSEDVISHCDTVFDAIYNPTKTVLLQTAEKLGKKAIGGMAMLVLQAVKAHEIWNGDTYTDDEIAEIITQSEKKVEDDFQ